MRRHSYSDTCDHGRCHLVPSILLSPLQCVGPALMAGESMSCCLGCMGGSAYIAVGALVGCAGLCQPVRWDKK